MKKCVTYLPHYDEFKFIIITITYRNLIKKYVLEISPKTGFENYQKKCVEINIQI